MQDGLCPEQQFEALLGCVPVERFAGALTPKDTKRLHHSTVLDPIPQHNKRNHAMKYYSPTLHTQHHTMKHLPPQHAKNNQNSPIFTMQGRTFFHNTHHTPTPGRHFFQPTGPSPHQTQAAHNSTTTVAQHCEPAGTNRTPERNCLRHHHDSGAKPPEKSHVIRLSEVLRKSENVAIPTI